MLSTFLLSAGGTWLLLRSALAPALLDVPGPRSNHAKPVPRMGGLALLSAVAAVWMAAELAGWPTGLLESHSFWVVIAAGALAGLSLADDVRSLPAGWRLCVQAVLVALATSMLPADELAFAGALPLLADRAAIVVLWLGFLNAYNFMDGIDGITGVTTLGIAAGMLLMLPAGEHDAVALPAILAGAALGFLWFNWHPARIFLGDVGSVPLGFLVGALLVSLAVHGDAVAAVILPAYYLVDTGLTLVERSRQGKAIWEAHSDHAYQRAVRRGLPHDRVALAVGAISAALVVLAVMSRNYPLPSLAAAYALAALFFWTLRSGVLDRLAGAGSAAERR
ncbi:MAG TPA: glycosyltransferase family 4 protein [Afifellaceae bacterium]|nr:glycosyltransferase family 4 protein [Afifellaceae bacterium]